MKEYRAEIKRELGTVEHMLGEEIIDVPKSLRIELTDSGVFLLRLDSSGKCIADTWHEDIVAAMQQAAFEYVLEESGWQES